MGKQAKAIRSGGAKAEFCAGLEWAVPGLEWFDLTGVARAGRCSVAIELCEQGHADHYVGFRVRVVDVAPQGSTVLAEKVFLFDDYLGRGLESRTDGRADYDGRGACFYVSPGYGGSWGWYIAVPKSTRPFCSAVERFVTAVAGAGK